MDDFDYEYDELWDVLIEPWEGYIVQIGGYFYRLVAGRWLLVSGPCMN